LGDAGADRRDGTARVCTQSRTAGPGPGCGRPPVLSPRVRKPSTGSRYGERRTLPRARQSAGRGARCPDGRAPRPTWYPSSSRMTRWTGTAPRSDRPPPARRRTRNGPTPEADHERC
jgi:hypothetical protein